MRLIIPKLSITVLLFFFAISISKAGFVSSASVTGGLAVSPLYQTQTAAIFGVSLTSAFGNSNVTAFTFTGSATAPATSNLSAYFTSIYLYSCTTNNYTTGVKTLLTTVSPVAASPNVTISCPSQTITGANKFYFLVVDYSVPATVANFKFSLSNITTNGTFLGGVTGNTYVFTPPVIIGTALTTGLASGTYTQNTPNLAILGFSIQAYTTSNITSLLLSATQNIGTFFTNLRLYSCTTNNYSTGAKALITTIASPAALTSLTISGLSLNVPAGATNYYFIVADYTVGSSASTAFQLNLTNASVGATAYTVSGPITGAAITLTSGTYNWVGGSALNNWNTAANWSPATIPGKYDNVQIGVNAYTSTNIPTISTASECGSILFGSNNGNNNAVALAVNNVLTVHGDITVQSDTYNNIFSNQITNISGTGTVNAVNLNGIDNFTAAFSVTTNSSVANLNLSGNIALTTNGFLFFSVNSAFNLTGGTATVAGVLNSTNNLLIPLIQPTSTFTVTNATLNLTNTAALSGLDNDGTNVVDFNNTGAVINYAGAAQTVYTDATITGLSGGVTYNSLSFSGSGVKTPNGGNLHILGNFTNSLANNASDYAILTGTPVFLEGTAQTLTSTLGNGTTFGKVTISGAGTKNIPNGSSFNIASNGLLTMSGNVATTILNVSSSGLLTLLSDATSSASIAAISANPSIKGNVNVQRFLTGGNNLNYRSYRFMSSAVNTLGLLDISTIKSSYTANGTTNYGVFTGGPGAGFSISNPNPTIYLYKETLNPSVATQNASFISSKFPGITSISGTTLGYTSTTNGVPSSGSTTVATGNGYLLYFPGSSNPAVRTTGTTSIPPDDAVITNVGTINQQNILVNLWYTPNAGGLIGSANHLSYSNGVNDVGLNLVGNPYASTIDLQKIYSDNNGSGTNNYTTFYELLNINPGQQFVSYGWNGTTEFKSSPTLSSRYIASGQGFFVLALKANQTLTFKEDQKVYNTALLNNTSAPPGVLIAPAKNKIVADKLVTDQITPAHVVKGLHLGLQKEGVNADYCGIYFDKSGSDKYNNNDALDLDGVSPKTFLSSFTSDNVRTGINVMSDYTKGKRIKLFAKATTSGVYHLNLEDINIDTALFNVYLVDKLHNDSLDIVRYKSYAFDLNAADTTTFGANRFVLAVERKHLPPYQLISFTGQKVTGGVQVNWKTYNEGNFTGFVLQKQGANKQFTALQSLQSSGATNYSYVDHSPLNGSNVYRLQQNDIDGNITYSAPVTVAYNSSTATQSIFTIYPNPATELITVNLTAITKKSASYISNIYNTAGEIVGHRIVSGDSWTEDVTAFKSGIYVIELKGSDGAVIGKSKFLKAN